MPCIVDDDLYTRALAKLSRSSFRKSNSAKEDYILTGVLKCADCGHKFMHGEVSYGGHSKIKYCNYKCPRNSGCSTSINKDYIERATANVVATLANKYCAGNVRMNKVLKSMYLSWDGGITATDQTIKSLENELDGLIKSLGKLTVSEVVEHVNAEIKRVNDELTYYKQIRTNAKTAKEIVKKTNGFTKITADELLKDHVVLKEYIAFFIEDITISKGNVIFNLKDLG